jgi:hypothetical protein
MDLSWDDAARAGRLEDHIEGLAGALGHKDRDAPFRHYCAGLLLPGERKSVEPMAVRLSPGSVCAGHQPLLHFVGQSPWSAAAVPRPARQAGQLPGGGSRARPLRGPRLARLPPPRGALRRGLRIPPQGADRDSPLRTVQPPPPSRSCLIRRLPTPRRRRSDPSGTSRHPSPRCTGSPPWRWQEDRTVVNAVSK